MMTIDKKQLPPPPRIDVKVIGTDDVVYSVQLHNTNERHIERVMMGMLRNLRDGLVLKEVLK
jgi:hypothetical protein